MNKSEFDNRLPSFNKQITSNKTKHLTVQKKLNSLITKDYIFIFSFAGEFILQLMMDFKTHLFINQPLIH